MDVLMCPSCSSRYAVSRAREDDGWRCINCSAELRTVEHAVPSVRLFGPELHPFVDDGDLHPLGDRGALTISG